MAHLLSLMEFEAHKMPQLELILRHCLATLRHYLGGMPLEGEEMPLDERGMPRGIFTLRH
ncbi:MAG: hypothetical protein DMF53_00035 [Acidobacteria bacterium]|nr:MAG: hypothetical protein DMF53_00035 [Acidobacteriota bacterium]